MLLILFKADEKSNFIVFYANWDNDWQLLLTRIVIEKTVSNVMEG